MRMPRKRKTITARFHVSLYVQYMQYYKLKINSLLFDDE